ncbi:MAG TPA: RNA-binding cell elongation regulator Jag/EloR [Fimbriimonas sp.]|nr:RNA-binding cell elongation regulator Jag/EloR [Fimbriimonas sp.]
MTAKTVEEAKKMAAERLGVPADQVKVTVLEETKGLFGKTQLRVKAEAGDPGPAKPEPKSRAKSAVKETPKETVAAIQETVEPKAEEIKKERRGGRDTRRVGKKPEAEAAPVAEEREEERSEGGGSASEADGEVIVGVLRDLLDSADLQVTANVREISGRYVNIQLDGKDAAHLVGKHGEVINALQYLLNIIVQRQVPSGARATLDANDYRRRREDALTKLATRIAEQVLDRQEEAVLDALPAFERRIVHKALSVIGGIQTYSEGEEPNRRVVIAPAD